jgi:uncharacterized protein (DUF58 family)
MNRFIVPIAVVIVTAALTVYAATDGSSWHWQILGFVFAVCALSLIAHMAPMSAVTATRTMNRGPHAVGDVLVMTISLSTRRRWFWPYLLVVDQLPRELGVSEPRFVLYSLNRGSATVTYRIPLVRRGIYHWTSLKLTTGDPFGFFFHRVAVINAPADCVVWPATVALPSQRGSHPRWHQGRAQRPLAHDDTAHVRGIRDYLPGDRLGQIHWKASARMAEWKVKEFEPERAPQMMVVLDHAACFAREDWETAVSVAASLVRHAFQQHEPCGFFALDDPGHMWWPDTAPHALTAIMTQLSGLPHEPAATLMRTTSLVPWAWFRDFDHLAVVTAPARRELWNPRAAWVVMVGPGALQSLEQLPQAFHQAWRPLRGG